MGETALINHFIDGKNAIYLMGVESSAKQNLENFSRSVTEYDSGMGADAPFPSFQAALETIFRRSEAERLILAIDEYPYVARASTSLASTLQMIIDKYKERSRMMLILCGSSMSYIEDHVLAYKAPLYGRRTAQIKLQPFDFEETCRYFENFGKSPVEFTSLGRWWGSDPVHNCQAEIDIMGEQDKNTALFAECKWTAMKVDRAVLETLIEHSGLFPYQNKHLFLFSKSGFTKGCADRAEELGNVSLVTYGDIAREVISSVRHI